MAGVFEVKNPDQLERYLGDKPAEWSRLIAARFALRVLPLMLHPSWPKEFWTAVLRACFISWAAGKYPAHDMKSAAFSAADSAAFSAAFSAASPTDSAALAAARSAALSAAFPADLAAFSAAHFTADSAANSAVWEAAETDLFELGYADAQSFEALMQQALWHGPMPTWVLKRWQRFIGRKQAIDDGYGPWIGWYHTLLQADGTPAADYFGEELTIRIATQPDEWWERDASEVNADIAEWLTQRNAEKIVVPDPEPGTTLGVAVDGRIGIVPSGLPSAEEQMANEGLLDVLGEKADELAELLTGSNAFALLLKDVRKYAEEVRRQALSIDRLYARGNVLENTRAHLQKDIDAGTLPDMALGVAAGLDSVLAIHGPLIASTLRGRELLDGSHIYESKAVDIAENRLAARTLAEAIARSNKTFTDEVREEMPAMAEAINTGPYPERSTQVALSGFKNLLIALAKVVAISIGGEAIITSVPGAMALGSLKETINLVWAFMTEFLRDITQFVQTIGPALSWMKPVLRLIGRGRE